MKRALGERVKTFVNASSNILPWMIEYASVLINRYLAGKDGETGASG